MRNPFIYFIFFFIAFLVVFFSLQQKVIYDHSLGLISENWKSEGDSKYLSPDAYSQIRPSSYIRWDADQYHLIKSHGYSIKRAGSDFIFAFFPLFPIIWKITFLPDLGILFLNYFLFVCSLLILSRLVNKDKISRKRVLLISLCLPSVIIFFIPYSEATYLFTISIGLYGFLKKNYWIYFIGFFLAALTRPSFTFLILSITCVEILLYLYHARLKIFITDLVKNILPLVLGTITVGLIQSQYEGGSFFKFIDVQKYWGNKLSMPHSLRDWSDEGFGINIAVTLLIGIPLLVILLSSIINYIKNRSQKNKLENITGNEYLNLVSLFYVVGSFLFIVFFRGGSLHCMFRFILCSPFFYILFFGSFNKVKNYSFENRFLFLGTLTLIACFVLATSIYSTKWNFSDTGFFVLILTLFLWVFQDSTNRFYKVFLYLTLFYNIVWTTYLFNTYLNNGWIFA